MAGEVGPLQPGSRAPVPGAQDRLSVIACKSGLQAAVAASQRGTDLHEVLPNLVMKAIDGAWTEAHIHAAMTELEASLDSRLHITWFENPRVPTSAYEEPFRDGSPESFHARDLGVEVNQLILAQYDFRQFLPAFVETVRKEKLTKDVIAQACRIIERRYGRLEFTLQP